jgi:hypothetical protein
MTTHLVTFSDESMSRARALCVSSALFGGGVDIPCVFTPEHLPLDMLERCKGQRGFGWWQWKPWIINRVMEYLPDSELVVYADAGVEFINNISHIIDRMGHEKPQDDVWLFGNNWEHAHWCKRDVIEAVWPQLFTSAPMNQWMEHAAGTAAHPTWNRFGKQVQASVIFFRVSDYSRSFVAEWLKWCLHEGGRLIDDSPSRLPNHPEFQEHRHDQAVLTTLAYREGIPVHYWPAVYNKGGSPEFVYEKLPEYAGDDYPVLFSHHRRRDHEWG